MRLLREKPNTTEYHRAADGRHVITLNLCEGAFTALRVVAHALGHNAKPEEYVLSSICDDAASMLTQITEEETKKFVDWDGGTKLPEQTPRHKVVFELSESAYWLLMGVVEAGGYDSPEHLMLAHASSYVAQSYVRSETGDQDEHKYAEEFGLKIEANGNTSLALPNGPTRPGRDL